MSIKALRSAPAVLLSLSLISGHSHASASCASGQYVDFCPDQGDFTYMTPVLQHGKRMLVNATSETDEGTWVGRAEITCSNGQVYLSGQSCTFNSSLPATLNGSGSQGGGTTTSTAGSDVSQVSIQSGDPCTTPSAQSIFNARMAAAQKQSVAINKELQKTVSNPIIAEKAIKNARSCNDMVRDALSSVFEGTPMGNIMSLLGLDKMACDALYEFQNNVESEFDTSEIEALLSMTNTVSQAMSGASTSTINGTSNDATNTGMGEWKFSGQFTPCTTVDGSSIQYRIYQCVNDDQEVILSSFCNGEPPKVYRACNTSNSGGAVNNAIY